jgi:hypothetical protein
MLINYAKNYQIKNFHVNTSHNEIQKVAFDLSQRVIEQL